MALLINGNGYSPVTAQQDADLYSGVVGNSTIVLSVGNEMAASIIDSTTVRILDGEAISQGRRIHIDAGSYDDFTIPAGSQGVTSYYIIGYRLYTNGGGDEVAATFVQATTQTGTITEEQLRDGASEAYVSFYRVTVEDLTIAAVTPLYSKRTPQLIQYGTNTLIVPANSYMGTIVQFANPFTSVPAVVASLHIDSTAADVGNLEIVTSAITTTSCTIKVHNNGASNKGVRFYWIAVANG